MPPKDDDDPKSTKEVVTKKQKQMLNREELDLSLIAEAFGGVVITESTDLVEFFKKAGKFLRRLANLDADDDMRDVPFESDPNIRRIKGQKILDRLLGSPPTNKAFNIVNIAKRSPHLAAALYAFEPTSVADATLDAARKRGDLKLFVPPKPKPGFVPSKPKPSIIPVKPGPPKRGPKQKPEPKIDPNAPTINPPGKAKTGIGLPPNIFRFPSDKNLGQSTIAIPQPQRQPVRTRRGTTTVTPKRKRDGDFQFQPPGGLNLYLGRRQNPQ